MVEFKHAAKIIYTLNAKSQRWKDAKLKIFVALCLCVFAFKII